LVTPENYEGPQAPQFFKESVMKTRIRIFCKKCGRRSLIEKSISGLQDHLTPGETIICPKCKDKNAKIKCVTFK